MHHRERKNSMQMTRVQTHLSAILAVALFVALAMKATSAKPTPTPVEVWCVGDDGLTIKLRDALEDAFKSSSVFRLSSGKKPGTLVVTIPSNVAWNRAGKRTRVSYKAEFTLIDNSSLGGSAGSCWDDTLTKCATQIVRDAKVAARRVSGGRRVANP